MIDKLNFSGAGANMNIESPQSSIGDSLLTLGKYYTQKDITEQERLLQAKKDQHALEREGITDARYEADKKERLDDKNRLLQKDYNTANAMSAIENKDAYIAGRMSAEQKAIQDTLASATPEDRLQMQQELKGYDPKASGQQWASTALSQSNVDSKDITNLKRDITKEAADEKYKQASLALQKQQYALANQERADRLQDKKDLRTSTAAAIEAKLNPSLSSDEKIDPTTGLKSKVIEKGTGNLILDKTKQNEFNVENDKLLTSEKLANMQKDLENTGNMILSPEQKTDENIIKLWKEKYGNKVNQSAIGGTLAGLKGELRDNSDPKVNSAKQNLSEFLMSNTRGWGEGKQKNAEYDSELKKLQDNVKIAESNASKKVIESENIPEYETFKNNTLVQSNIAESELGKKTKEFSTEYDKLQKDLIKNKNLGIEEKVNTEIAVTPEEIYKNVYDSTIKNAMAKDKNLDITTAQVVADKTAQEAADKQRVIMSAAAKIGKENKQSKSERLEKNLTRDISSIEKDIDKLEAESNKYSTDKYSTGTNVPFRGASQDVDDVQKILKNEAEEKKAQLKDLKEDLLKINY